MREWKRVTVNKKAETALREGHPWVYAEEAREIPDAADGDIVDVYSEKGRFLGAGFFNRQSKILVRVLSANANDRFDEAFWRRRVRYALDYRRTVMGEDLACCRLIFGDADGFPGFVADRFNDALSVQIMCYGIETRKDLLFRLLLEELEKDGVEIAAVYERNDVKTRAKEGLPLYKGEYALPGRTPTGRTQTEICENGVYYTVDFAEGQKTGFFLDQKYNRRAAAAIAPGKTVLDCFTHTGSFALNCAKAGAKRVTAVDISAEAVAMTERNAARNGVSNMDFVCADVFDYLKKLGEAGKSPYDYIILDPPAFTKSRGTVAAAYKGYKEINLAAMRLLPRGGYLATCSCSHFMTDELFRRMLHEAAMEAKVQLRVIEYRQQAPDHPVLLGVPETEYLKFYLLQVV
ncbi:MAG: class I SAM-dependent rRNA methyltransferase [Clostridia bacterium]|nr:class I SAM-dependent rRNA methyltransferase [Clostridia bacterium]